MLNAIRSLSAALYGMRVHLNLGMAQEVSDPVRFPAYLSLVRRARVSGLKPKQCAQMIRSVVGGFNEATEGQQTNTPVAARSRDTALNAAMVSMESNDRLWSVRA